MTAWLFAHLQFYAVLGALAAMAVWESFRPLRKPVGSTARRWIDNAILATLGSGLARLCLPLAGIACAQFAQARGLGLLNLFDVPPWLAFAITVLALDLGHYATHRLVHAVPLLWRIHKIHHADLHVDCATAVRHHPLDTLLAASIDLLVIAALGATPLGVLAASTLTLAVAAFSHANVSLGAKLDAVLRRVVVTPAMHVVHHSSEHDEANSNYTVLFSWWDRWFGTWKEAPRLGLSRLRVGIAEARHPEEVALVRSLAMPFRRERRSAVSPVLGPRI